MAVIDFHSHILPGIDDGSKNPDISKEMLRECVNQKIDIIFATPHFYADEDRIEHFLEKRDKAYERLRQIQQDDFPKILLGAEVAYFPGISNSRQICQFFLEGTNILLLEMPFGAWNKSEFLEVKKMILESDFRIMLAHLERFLLVSANKQYIYELMQLPVIVQFNAESLSERKLKKMVLKSLKDDFSCVLGSDCHNMKDRKPNLSEGRKIISEKLGDEALRKIDIRGMQLLNQKK